MAEMTTAAGPPTGPVELKFQAWGGPLWGLEPADDVTAKEALLIAEFLALMVGTATRPFGADVNGALAVLRRKGGEGIMRHFREETGT